MVSRALSAANLPWPCPEGRGLPRHSRPALGAQSRSHGGFASAGSVDGLRFPGCFHPHLRCRLLRRERSRPADMALPTWNRDAAESLRGRGSPPRGPCDEDTAGREPAPVRRAESVEAVEARKVPNAPRMRSWERPAPLAGTPCKESLELQRRLLCPG